MMKEHLTEIFLFSSENHLNRIFNEIAHWKCVQLKEIFWIRPGGEIFEPVFKMAIPADTWPEPYFLAANVVTNN